MSLYKNKYRIESSRLKKWDYSAPGHYFITICTKDRKCLFGNVTRGKMILSEMGKIAEQYWREIPDHFNHVKLDEFVVMPNHIHGIIIRELITTPPKSELLSTNTNEYAQSAFAHQTREYRYGKPVITTISYVMNMN